MSKRCHVTHNIKFSAELEALLDETRRARRAQNHLEDGLLVRVEKVVGVGLVHLQRLCELPEVSVLECIVQLHTVVRHSSNAFFRFFFFFFIVISNVLEVVVNK